MFPWTHAAFGYLLLVCLGLLLSRRISKAELVAVLIGTQLADVVDKPLAWWFAAIPSGRSLGHSLLIAVPLSVAVIAAAWYHSHPEVGVAFGLGYASHLLGDTYVALYYWRVEEFTFLLWPLLPAYPYDDFGGFLDFAGQLEITRPVLIAALVSAAIGTLFLAHFSRAPLWYSPRSN
ncbi:metal-dependent hydrolase [Haloarcula sp. CBA1130]|uniref:metal-dependent hydrolase n=1 Tax=unclassified Haloarcula TaxID=2624677 RepID=UPI0012474EEF|nr:MULTISPECIES: metal-dependent hydrolase [unclassified Haloarcula]KAA9396481.1 metal-dependent hydrolase [Haloarcula sp. CBA1130]KAA9397662.1 metal-dependent hydrolase [Haloarcula sp. CBA1129]